MTWLLWSGLVLGAAALSYVTQFSGATLFMGKALSDGDTGRGFQDAITPPWQTNLALLVYFSLVAVVGLMFWNLGWVSGVLAIVAVFPLALVLRRFLPPPDSPHFQQLIVRSMANRYADYVRGGDTVRAEAMKGLLRRAGVDPDVARNA
jgi:hypothetical protein